MFCLKVEEKLKFSKFQICTIGIVSALIWEIHSTFYLYRTTLPNNFLDVLIWVFILVGAGTITVFFMNKVLLHDLEG
ncbi:MAG: hypothetical protein WAQ98_33580 [Blastocatellia bacterium]